MEINPTYRKKIEQIKIDGEDYANEEMKHVYSLQKSKLDELHTLVGAMYIKYAVDGLLNLTIVQKASITSEIKNKLKTIGKDLGQAEVDKVTNILGEVFKTTYYKNAYTMESGMEVNLKLPILKQEFIDKAVKTEFKGEMFSDRIWKNKADMIDKLHSQIVEAMKGEIHLDKVARNIKNTFNVTAYQSQRLVNTETARIQSQASDEIARTTGVNQQMYSATLDGKTAPECAALDGKVWDVNDPEKVIPPSNHPFCRCVLCNIPYDGWSATARKDNESKNIIDYTNYEDWAKAKGIKS